LPSTPVSSRAIRTTLEKTAIYGKIAQEFRGRKPLIEPEKLVRAVEIFQSMGRNFSIFNRKETYTIEELEVNPLVVTADQLVPLDGLCRFHGGRLKSQPGRLARLKNFLSPKLLA